MAVKTISDVKLQVKVENGTNTSGAAALKNINLNDVKLTATDAELLAAGEALANLQSHSLAGYKLIDTYDLAAEE